MTKEAKQGYQPIHHKNSSAVPPNAGSNVRMKENGKRIAELEKENTELKTVKIPQLERKIASIRGAHSVDCRKLNARTEQVERLKKENAELKSDFIKSCKVKEQGFKEAEQALERKDKQLTKAKEIIEAMLIYQEGFSHMGELKQEAEQFLKEE